MFMPAWGSVLVSSFVFLISFSNVGQRRASKPQAVINTNVTINWVGSVDSDVKEKVFGRLKNESSLLRRQFIHGGQIFGTCLPDQAGADNLFKVFGSQTNG